MLGKGKSVQLQDLHHKLSHVNEGCARKTAAVYGWQLTEKFSPCEDCATAKARQKNLKKLTETRGTVPGERLFLDMSSVKGESLGGAKFWLLLLGDCTGMCWSFFLTHKSATSKQIVPFIKELASKYTKVVKYIRCDNAGKNTALKDACANTSLGVHFEFTAPGTP
jgi:hypothetical protein